MVAENQSSRRREEESLLYNESSSESDSEDNAVFDYEHALEKTGFGRFHFLLLMVCGLANASDAIEVLCISFQLPSAECELMLTTSDKGWLSAVMFIGMLFGGYIWGSLADTFGRKRALILSLFINAFCGFGSSFVSTKGWFMLVRFFSGIGVGGSIPVTWSYFAEFQPRARRGSMMSFLATFWMVGNIMVAGLAWLIIPQNIKLHPGDEFTISWRVFTAICAGPALIASIGFLFLPESPKYLLVKGMEGSAIQVLKRIHHINTGGRKGSYPVTRIISDVRPGIRRRQTPKEKFAEMFSNTKELFVSEGVWQNTLKMLFINFAIAFGYFGLWIWFPELFNKLDQYYHYNPNKTVSICDVTDFVPPPGNVTSNPFCHLTVPNSSMFFNSFLTSLAAFPGNVWTILQMDTLGRKFFLVFSMVLSGCSAFLIYLVTSQTSNLIVSCVFGLVSTMGFNSLDCLAAELFPTHLRSTAFAVTLAAGRLGAILANIVFGYFITVSCAIPILSVAVLLTLGGLLGIFLPNTTNVSID